MTKKELTKEELEAQLDILMMIASGECDLKFLGLHISYMLNKIKEAKSIYQLKECAYQQGLSDSFSWIPVEESLPNCDELVQVKKIYIECPEIVDYDHAELDCNQNWYSGDGVVIAEDGDYRITHWRKI